MNNERTTTYAQENRAAEGLRAAGLKCDVLDVPFIVSQLRLEEDTMRGERYVYFCDTPGTWKLGCTPEGEDLPNRFPPKVTSRFTALWPKGNARYCAAGYVSCDLDGNIEIEITRIFLFGEEPEMPSPRDGVADLVDEDKEVALVA